MDTSIPNADANPIACVALLVVCLITLLASGRNAIKALLFTSAIIPMGERFYILGIHVHFFRILILVGVTRLMMRGETQGFQWNKVDKLTMWWAATALLCGFIRGIRGETFGMVFAALGAYFLVRCLCKGPEDFLEHLRFLALVMFGIALCMCVEAKTLHNPFAILGGVDAVPFLRAGRARCQGPFLQFILAGAFSATLFPLMAGLWLQGPPHRRRAVLGMVGTILGTYLCNSSGPLICFLSALVGFALWPMRNHMRLFRRGCVALIIASALVMKAPVWYLMTRLDPFGGTSWHRAYLIDQFFGHITQWFLVGTDYTANWAPGGEVLAVDPDNMDITNNYIMQALRGGIWELGLFLAIIVCCFKIVGGLVRGSSDGVLAPKMRWAIGVALAGHCMAFMDISYFDQIAVFWYWLVAVIAGFSAHVVSSDSLAIIPEQEDAVPEEVHVGAEFSDEFGAAL
jgi:hypothetical protein